MVENKLSQKPLNYENHEKPGSYKLASVLRESVLNPGGLIEIDQFITGYGSSSGLKITCYPSNELFVESESIFESGLGPSEENDDTIVWGGKIGTISNNGISIAVPSMKTPNWQKNHAIFDMNLNANFVMTERKTPKPPLSYRLKLKKDATPGPHYINFYLTYFNGSEWACQEERISFKINNKFEQHSTLLSWLAAAALLVTIAHDGIYPAFQATHEIGVFISDMHQR